MIFSSSSMEPPTNGAILLEKEVDQRGNTLCEIGVGIPIHLNIIPGAMNRSVARRDMQPCLRNVLAQDQREIMKRDPLEQEIGVILGLPHKVIQRLLCAAPVSGFSKDE